MSVLPDTHTFLWFIDDHPNLSATARAIIEAERTVVFLSTASVWEIAIKHSIGKLVLREPLEIFIPQQLTLNAIDVLHIDMRHVIATATLPFHQRDPFDRLLAVQALAEGLSLVSSDAIFDQYGVSRIWV